MYRRLISLFILLFAPIFLQAQGRILHAHNDYEHPRPLLDALQHGFTSVEVDIHLLDGVLAVAHDTPRPPFRTLEELYLEPLRSLFQENKGHILPENKGVLYLLIDIKTEAKNTWEALYMVLQSYADIITLDSKAGGIWPIISGSRAIKEITEHQPKLASLDGRPAQLGIGLDDQQMPWISENYVRVIGSLNRELPSPDEQEKIKTLAELVHREGKKLRLWFTPESEEVWELLIALGVDILNTDELSRMQGFMEREH
jgi:glycerophosphoryl diester phosphodiesterase